MTSPLPTSVTNAELYAFQEILGMIFPLKKFKKGGD
jgi:hypothetical protein